MGRRLKDAQSREDVRSLRELAALCGDNSTVRREARLLLAEMLMRQRKFLEAEIECERVRRQREDSVHEAQALEMLGRLMLAENLLPDAAYYYRLLRRDFGKTALPDGRTGAEVWDALSTDKRLLPYLEEFNLFANSRLRARRVNGSFPMVEKVFPFEQNGENLPFFRRHRVGLQLARDTLQLMDRDTGEESWQAHLLSLRGQLFPRQINESSQTSGKKTRFWYHTLGHLLVLPVADRVFACDPVQRRVLWEKSLVASDNGSRADRFSRKEPRSEAGSRGLELTYPDGFVLSLKRNIVLSPSALCLVTRGRFAGGGSTERTTSVETRLRPARPQPDFRRGRDAFRG